MRKTVCKYSFFLLVQLYSNAGNTQFIKAVRTSFVDSGWAGNSVNTVIFRKNALCTFRKEQYISFYNKDGFVVLGKRSLSSKKWTLQTTVFKGNIADAHNSISMMTDGDGFLHLAWDHHNNRLRYAKSIAPGSLQMTEEMPMTGIAEKNITYPEFYSLPDGNLLFFYRDGQSGQGNLVINRYEVKTKQWVQLHTNLIDGQKKRNAYWQACVDSKGTIHLSWVWRESSDVASNHDLCYAKSTDGGRTWMNSKNESYALPITAASAEYIVKIPQKSELINQTSMAADKDGNPFIASYWKDQGDSVPQYHIAYHTGIEWKVRNTGFRRTAFSLGGTGTKRIPISRPQVVVTGSRARKIVVLFFRDEERGSKVSMAISHGTGFPEWKISNLSADAVGSWEPTYDTELWKYKKQLHLFVQYADQQDAEGLSAMPAQPIQVIELKTRK
jgi:hypothetical protein